MLMPTLFDRDFFNDFFDDPFFGSKDVKKMEKKRGRCIFRQRSFANFCMKPGKWKGAM